MIAHRAQRVTLAGAGDARSLTALAPASSVTVNRRTGAMPRNRLSIRANRGLGAIRVGALQSRCQARPDGVRIAAGTLTAQKRNRLARSSSLLSARWVVNGGVSLDSTGHQPGR